MLSCCERNYQGRIYAVADNQFFFNRVVEYSRCSICDKFVLRLSEYRYSDNRLFENVYKGRKAKRMLRELKPFLIKHIHKIKSGSKSNQNWVYGNTVITRKHKRVYAVNFNGEKKLID